MKWVESKAGTTAGTIYQMEKRCKDKYREAKREKTQSVLDKGLRLPRQTALLHSFVEGQSWPGHSFLLALPVSHFPLNYCRLSTGHSIIDYFIISLIMCLFNPYGLFIPLGKFQRS